MRLRFPECSAFTTPVSALLLFSLAVLLSAACAGKAGKSDESEECSDARKEMEAEAALRLASARRSLAAGRTAEARSAVEKMRKDCYLALTARRRGILLMESIDISEAKSRLAAADSLLRGGKTTQADFDEACRKVQFYERKLRHDRQQMR